MDKIIPGDLINVALSVQDRIALDEFCDLTRRGRSEVMEAALRQYLGIHGPIVLAVKQVERMQRELSRNYMIPMPPELQ